MMETIISNFDPSEKKHEEENSFESAVTSIFQLCERENLQLSESCLMRIIMLKRNNILIYALKHILKVADNQTLMKLVNIHNDLPRGYRRGMFLDTIETLSNRFGYKVMNVNGELEAVL